MKDTFYIAEVNNNWYNLRVKETHYCVSCGDDVEKLLKVIEKYVRKYRDSEHLYRVLSKLDCKGRVPTHSYMQWEREHLMRSRPYKELVEEAVDRALKEKREQTPFRKAKNRVKLALTPKKEKAEPLEPTVIEEPVVRKIAPIKITRTVTI